MTSLANEVRGNTANINKVNKVVVSLSGGLDSTILLHLMVDTYGKDNVYALSFDYNQRHDVELVQAKKSTELLGVNHKVVDITFMGEIAAGVSAMVKGSVETPTMEDVLGEPQPVTYMPNRNMMLAAITAGYAESVGADGLALGIQKIDSYSYWDTTPEFYEAVENVLSLNRKHPISFIAPFLSLSKIEEIKLATELGVKFENTWTCYDPVASELPDTMVDEPAGGKNPVKHTHYEVCGTCPSCFERANAFKQAGVIDPIAVDGVDV